MIKEYRKTATIKAERFDGSDEMIEKYKLIRPIPRDPNYMITMLNGVISFGVGDWIAKGANGEHWAITDDIFKKTYVEVKLSECKYCDVKNNGESTQTFTDNAFGNYPVSCGIVRPEINMDDYHLKAGNYYLETEGDDAVFQAINYCPICGRKLGD